MDKKYTSITVKNIKKKREEASTHQDHEVLQRQFDMAVHAACQFLANRGPGESQSDSDPEPAAGAEPASGSCLHQSESMGSMD